MSKLDNFIDGREHLFSLYLSTGMVEYYYYVYDTKILEKYIKYNNSFILYREGSIDFDNILKFVEEMREVEGENFHILDNDLFTSILRHIKLESIK